MGKDRTPVPSDIAVEVLFNQDHTCCVCRDRGKSVQIHHIDNDPTNHAVENLAVLCFDDHERTQVIGGFGRKLLPPEILRYRNDWIERVNKRRHDADIVAIEAMGSAGAVAKKDDGEWAAPPFALLISYVEHLPQLRRAAYENARYGWDTGVTAEMRRATAEVIDILERVLVYLANWYPPNHFGEKGAPAFFSEFIATRYFWHRALFEPEGPGSGGTLAGVLAGGGALTDVERAVGDMVEALSAGNVDLIRWRRKWEKAADRPLSIPERIREKWDTLIGRT